MFSSCDDAKKEGTAPGVTQGAGTACRCMRGTESLCHVALSKDTRLLIRVRPCGPFSTSFNRRSRSKMARAYTGGFWWPVVPRYSASDKSVALPRLCASTLHLPARTLPSFACLPASLCWQIPRACERVWCLRGPLVRECPALVCACLPCACVCALSYTWSTYSIAVSSPTP